LGDEKAPGTDPDAVDEDDIVDLAGDGHERLQAPAPGGVVTERAPGSAADFGLRCLARQPPQETAQLLAFAHVTSGANG